MFGRKGVQLATIVVVIGISYGSLAFTINRPCTEEGSNKISATYNRTIFDLHGTAGICLYRVNYDQPQLKREVLVCLDKTSPDPVCAGNNYTNPCTVIGETEITGNGTTQKTYFNVPGWNTTYVVSFKFKGEGHFYPVEEDICWRIWNISKVQGGGSPATTSAKLPFTTQPKSGGNSSSITSPPPDPTPNPGNKVLVTVIAVVVGLIFICLVVFFYCRRRCSCRGRDSEQLKMDTLAS